MKESRAGMLAVACAFTTALVYSQNFNAFSQNTSRSNHIGASEAWSFSLRTGAAFGIKSNESALFRGSGFATQLAGKYYFGNFGLGLSGGFLPGTFNDNAIKKFLTDGKFPQDATVTKTKPGNSYLLFGPSVRFGNKVQFGAELHGGIFFNNAGGLSVNQPGVLRPLYRFENGTGTLFPGFSANLHIDYPINSSTHFTISTGYLQTKSNISVLDIRQGIDIPRIDSRDIRLLTAGVGIAKSFGNAGNKRKINNKGIVKGNINVSSGSALRPSGANVSNIRKLRTPPTESYNPWELDDANEISTTSCGPVIQKTTTPDGTVKETTFACPEDAAVYNQKSGQKAKARIVNNYASHKGNQKENTDNNILIGRVSWSSSAADANGIVTNKSKLKGMTAKPGGAVSSSYAAGIAGNTTGGNGVITNLYVRDPSSGMATGKRSRETGAGLATGRRSRSDGSGLATGRRSRETGSGLATGRRQYEPLLIEGNDSVSTGDFGTVKSNPLYKGGSSGDNPLFESNKRTINTGDLDDDGVPELTVYLLDRDNGATLATTKTESNGSFYFANLPSGSYIVKVLGNVTAEKKYDITVNKNSDWAGQILYADDAWYVQLITDTGTVETSQAIQKVKTKSNHANDKASSNDLIWSPRSNKMMNTHTGDLDGDGRTDFIVGSSGVKASSSPAMKPGNPIGGIIVKGGKNPGGQMITVQTNQYGEFEYPGLEPGNYIISADLNYYIDDESLVTVGDDNVSQNPQSSPNSTATRQTQGKTFGESVASGLQAGRNSLTTKNGNDNSKVVVRGWDTKQKENIQRSINTSDTNLKNMTDELDKLDQQLNKDKNNSPDAINTSRSSIKNLKAVIADVQQTMNNLMQKEKEAALQELEQKMEVMDTQYLALQNSLSDLGTSYTAISNELKTKHDTVKNSINNVR